MSDSLTVSWPYLLIAIALLWFPRQWLRTGKTLLKKRRKPDGALERLAGMGARGDSASGCCDRDASPRTGDEGPSATAIVASTRRRSEDAPPVRPASPHPPAPAPR